jgi:Fur family peroxide stress response transcriptional regulator
VYNCLSVLVQCGLVRQVTLERSPARFCPNMSEHCHFYCEECGEVTDIDLPRQNAVSVPLPAGFRVSHLDVSLRGRCSKCGR